MVMKRLEAGCRTTPDNYKAKGFESISNPIPGSTVTEEHWARAKRYEEELARKEGKSYYEIAQEIISIEDNLGSKML